MNASLLPGVLTKPDRIPSGEEDNWLRYIRNQEEPLEHGWFSVKQPDSRAIAAGITWEEAREKEHEFFSTQSPWNVLDLEYQNRLGTDKLVDRLSDVLSECISQRYASSISVQTELSIDIRSWRTGSLTYRRSSRNCLPGRTRNSHNSRSLLQLMHCPKFCITYRNSLGCLGSTWRVRLTLMACSNLSSLPVSTSRRPFARPSRTSALTPDAWLRRTRLFTTSKPRPSCLTRENSTTRRMTVELYTSTMS